MITDRKIITSLASTHLSLAQRNKVIRILWLFLPLFLTSMAPEEVVSCLASLVPRR